MDRHALPKLSSQIYTEACAWFVECRSGSLDEVTRREFDRWLRKSPEHLSAYLEIAAIWNEGPLLDARHEWDADRLVAQASEDQGNVVALARGVADEPAQRTGSAKSTRRLSFIAASVTLAAMMGGLTWYQVSRTPTYATEFGEQRSIALPDGSTVELNSRSRIKVRYSERERALQLLEGQALFRVAENQARPFTVTSDGTRVRAVGTEFDVYKKRSGTVVTVVEGRVAILTNVADPELLDVTVDPPQLSFPSPASEVDEHGSKRAGGGPRIFVAAGEQVTVTHAAVQEIVRPNIASAIAWRQRQLIFESASLSEVAEEFNRYNERQLVVRDADLYDFHISGVFSSTDPTSLIRFLRERPGVEVVETRSQIMVTKKIPQEVTDP